MTPSGGKFEIVFTPKDGSKPEVMEVFDFGGKFFAFFDIFRFLIVLSFEIFHLFEILCFLTFFVF